MLSGAVGCGGRRCSLLSGHRTFSNFAVVKDFIRASLSSIRRRGEATMPKPRSRPSSDAQRRPPIRRDSTRVVNRLTTFPTHACWSEILKRSDGKDRVVGLIQYVAMVISGGRPGSVLTSIGFALNDARRPFRLYTPVAVLIDTFLAKGVRPSRPEPFPASAQLYPKLIHASPNCPSITRR